MVIYLTGRLFLLKLRSHFRRTQIIFFFGLELKKKVDFGCHRLRTAIVQPSIFFLIQMTDFFLLDLISLIAALQNRRQKSSQKNSFRSSFYFTQIRYNLRKQKRWSISSGIPEHVLFALPRLFFCALKKDTLRSFFFFVIVSNFQ